jgi:hypothetical protein
MIMMAKLSKRHPKIRRMIFVINRNDHGLEQIDCTIPPRNWGTPPAERSHEITLEVATKINTIAVEMPLASSACGK